MVVSSTTVYSADTPLAEPQCDAPNRVGRLLIVRDVILAVVMMGIYFFVPFWIMGLRLYDYNWRLFASFNLLVNFLFAWFFISRIARGYLSNKKWISWATVIAVLVLAVIPPYKTYGDLIRGASHFEGAMRMESVARTISFNKNNARVEVVFGLTDFRRFNEALCRCGQNSHVRIDYLEHTDRVVEFECSKFGSQNMPKNWQKECR